MPVLICLTACQSIYQSENDSPFAPREYFRAIEVEPIGKTILEENEGVSTLDGIKNKIKNETAIKDVVILTKDNQTVVALKPFAYKRMDIDRLLKEYRETFKEEGMTAVLFTEPGLYRKAKEMKEIEEVSSGEWNSVWGKYFEVE